MLALAIQYAGQLQAGYQAALMDDKYRFYWQGASHGYFVPLEQDDSRKLQYVSVGVYGDVLGFFECNLNRDTMTAYNVTAMRFAPGHGTEFAADMYRFVVDLLFKQYGINRVVFNVIVGNPAERLYDRICERYGGRVIGTFTQEARLRDGRLYDVKYYEMLKGECLSLLEDAGAEMYRLKLFMEVEHNV